MTACDQLVDEVVTAKAQLEQIAERPVRYFAFPYGMQQNLNAAVFALAENVGYDGVCSAYGGFNFPGEDPFHMQRIPVDNYLIRLKNWATVDPRKRRVLRFQYEQSPAGREPAAESRPMLGVDC